MDWEGRQESSNVEDRRGFGGKKTGLAIGGGAGLIVMVVALILGIDPSKLGVGGGGQDGGDDRVQQDKPNREFSPEEQRMASFSKVVFRDTEIVWEEQFEKMGKRYPKPTLVLYDHSTPTGCGEGDASIGPFYCPADSKVYIDLSFFVELDKKFGAPGEFARAYVIAHEVGHHVQRHLDRDYSAFVNEHRRDPNFNQYSVRLELQADYLAGVWAHYAQEKFKYLTRNDINSAINAAEKIGDDWLMKKAGRRVVPDNFTHGKSEQRQKWFLKGFETGNVKGARELFDLPYNQL